VALAAAVALGARVRADDIVAYEADGWKYSVVPTDAGAGFEEPGFDDSAWAVGSAPWGAWAAGSQNACPLNSAIVTNWPLDTDLLVRRAVSLCAGAAGLSVAVAVDNDVQVFWNGVDITTPPVTPSGAKIHDGCATRDEADFTFPVPAGLLLVGENVVALRAKDRGLMSFFDIAIRGAAGNCAPPPLDCSGASVNPQEIWPPNHRWKPLAISGVNDASGDPVAITVTGIFQDEAVKAKGSGSGNTCPDGGGLFTDTAWVRAERDGNPKQPGNGRVYTVAFTATDAVGAECSGVVRACVPHDRGQGLACIDDGPAYDSTRCN
jgi:hypothetical protein